MTFRIIQRTLTFSLPRVAESLHIRVYIHIAQFSGSVLQFSADTFIQIPPSAMGTHVLWHSFVLRRAKLYADTAGNHSSDFPQLGKTPEKGLRFNKVNSNGCQLSTFSQCSSANASEQSQLILAGILHFVLRSEKSTGRQ